MWQEEIQIERLRKGQANIRVRRETRQRKIAFISRFNPAKNARPVAAESTTNPSYSPSRSKVPSLRMPGAGDGPDRSKDSLSLGETTPGLMFDRDGRNFNLRATDQSGNLNCGSRWFRVWY